MSASANGGDGCAESALLSRCACWTSLGWVGLRFSSRLAERAGEHCGPQRAARRHDEQPRLLGYRHCWCDHRAVAALLPAELRGGETAAVCRPEVGTS